MSVRHVRRGRRTTAQFPGVVIYFQLYPGVHGTPADRGIANVPYSVRVAGRLFQTGNTNNDGSVAIPLPTQFNECLLRIFGIEYTVRVQPSDALAAPLNARWITNGDADPAHVGVRQRLYHLGYHQPPSGGFSDVMDSDLDRAILDFQINERLPGRPDGLVGPDTVARLQQREP